MNVEKSCGAVLFTEIQSKRYYVLVSSITEDNCGMPKGHIENNESEEETALREIKEETCVDAEIIKGFRKQVEYIMPNGITKQVVYFIARYENQEVKKNPSENLNVMLLPFDEALNTLNFKERKEILTEADNWLASFEN